MSFRFNIWLIAQTSMLVLEVNIAKKAMVRIPQHWLVLCV